ncbi:MAG: hypothetical protein HY565_03215 [Candidatus Kerfeldbacteria bacterium]|nr:hypothetical protein [Candidatus Kerfeldbacteria bacterium]
MNQTCQQCHTTFEITTVDEQFYRSFEAPNPTLCPDCRLQRRMAFRNERSLYNSKCGLCQRPIVTIYDPVKQFTVYCPECWWGDKWNPLELGREFDFTKTLADQLIELYRAVPHVSLYTTNCTNSEYNNFGLNLNNCYLIFGGSNNDNCLYGKFVISSIDTVDALSVFSTELCYEAVASERCYDCRYVVNSRDCRDCIMIDECQACTDCIGCFGLHNKQYYVFNQYVGKEEYEKILTSYQPLTTAKLAELRSQFEGLRQTLPRRASHIYASEHCSGDLILNSVNCHDCFDIKECENCRYVSNTPKAKDSYDAIFSSPYGLEHCYNTCSTTGLRDGMSAFMVWNSYNVGYSLECHQSHDLFGCVGMQKQQFSILNKQYSEADYKQLRAKVIEHMKTTGEWGEYLHPSISPFGYNETIAQEYYPLSEQAAKLIGYTWHPLLDKPANATADALVCVHCHKPYRLVKAELTFYAKAQLPNPQLCPDCRRTRRIVERGPYHLWSRQCSRCQKNIQTNYSPERAATVYCEQCYVQERG